jgi:hypothetical protein
MDETDQRVASLFTKKSHNRNISVMYIVQNLFHRGKHHRTIRLNSHYKVVFKNPRNKAGLRALTKKSFSFKKKKAILQKGGFLVSLPAPIASVVAPLLSTLFE